jgi:hypothetical protein
MFRLLSIASIHTRAFMRQYMPSNIILDRIRTRRGLKWGPLAMLLAVPYAAVAYWLTAVIKAGEPEWLYLIVLVCLWSALKMIWIGPVSLVVLARTRHAEAAAMEPCRAHRRALSRRRDLCVRLSHRDGASR